MIANVTAKTNKGLRRVNSLVHTPAPERIRKIHYAITYRCQGRCTFCNIWKYYRDNPKLSRQELDLRRIEQLFETSRYLRNVEEILLGGGEPFLREDFSALVHYFAKRYPQAEIYTATNALSPKLIERRLREILAFMPGSKFKLAVSLDGDAQTHGRMRGRKDAYQKVLNTIDCARRQCASIDITLSFTITRDNYEHLAACYELSKVLGTGFTMRFAQTSGLYYGNAAMDLGWTEADLKAVEHIIGEIIADLRKNRGVIPGVLKPDLYFFSRMVEYQRRPRRLIACFSGTHSLFLDPYGNVYPCINLKKKMGNITQEHFDRLWMSPSSADIRRFIAQQKCHCWTECEAFPSLHANRDAALDNVRKTARSML
jgi:radical SAM protein with 4Fe4S-binding SPASM domain